MSSCLIILYKLNMQIRTISYDKWGKKRGFKRDSIRSFYLLFHNLVHANDFLTRSNWLHGGVLVCLFVCLWGREGGERDAS